MLPLVSVIIPNYNHAKYLPRRIESVLGQTYSNIEVLLLDDCSTDDSQAIIAEYAEKDARIRVIINDKNSGSTFKQWNKGIINANGKYIWIAESDDYADNKLLETLVARLEADVNIGLAYVNSWNVDENDKVIDDNTGFYKFMDEYLWLSDFVVDGRWLVNNFMSYRNVIPNASAVLIRRHILDGIGNADESYRLNGDWLFWAKILLVSKVAFVAERFNYFRQHTNNVRSKTFVDGTALLELSRLLKKLNDLTNFEPFFFEKMLNLMVYMWFEGVLKYDYSFEKIKNIYVNMKKIDPNINYRIKMQFNEIFPSNYSAIKQFLGDGLLYKYFFKQRRNRF